MTAPKALAGSSDFHRITLTCGCRQQITYIYRGFGGVGHIYLGYAKREGSILLFAFVVSFGAGAGVLLPFPLSGLVTLVYWIWQIYDAYKHYKKIFPPDYFMNYLEYVKIDLIISTTGI